jgi:hypothetical protein
MISRYPKQIRKRNLKTNGKQTSASIDIKTIFLDLSNNLCKQILNKIQT